MIAVSLMLSNILLFDNFNVRVMHVLHELEVEREDIAVVVYEIHLVIAIAKSLNLYLRVLLAVVDDLFGFLVHANAFSVVRLTHLLHDS